MPSSRYTSRGASSAPRIASDAFAASRPASTARTAGPRGSSSGPRSIPREASTVAARQSRRRERSSAGTEPIKPRSASASAWRPTSSSSARGIAGRSVDAPDAPPRAEPSFAADRSPPSFAASSAARSKTSSSVAANRSRRSLSEGPRATSTAAARAREAAAARRRGGAFSSAAPRRRPPASFDGAGSAGTIEAASAPEGGLLDAEDARGGFALSDGRSAAEEEGSRGERQRHSCVRFRVPGALPRGRGEIRSERARARERGGVCGEEVREGSGDRAGTHR